MAKTARHQVPPTKKQKMRGIASGGKVGGANLNNMNMGIRIKKQKKEITRLLLEAGDQQHAIPNPKKPNNADTRASENFVGSVSMLSEVVTMTCNAPDPKKPCDAMARRLISNQMDNRRDNKPKFKEMDAVTKITPLRRVQSSQQNTKKTST